MPWLFFHPSHKPQKHTSHHCIIFIPACSYITSLRTFSIAQKIAKLSKNFYLNHKISFKKRQKDNNIRPVPADRPRAPSG
jgi:hypothetical protein